MASKLNPGADATLVGVAYRAAMANTPKDYSDTLERAADSYAKTMEASSEMWSKIAKVGAKLGGEMVKNANERAAMAAKANTLNPEDAEFLIGEIYGNKDAQKELGFLPGVFGDRETKMDLAKLKMDQQKLFAEIDLAAESIKVGTDAVASGAFDTSLSMDGGEMVNAIIKSGLKNTVTDNQNVAKLGRNEFGELTYTLYKENGELTPNPNGTKEPVTMTIKQFNEAIATNVDDKGAKAAIFDTYNNQVAERGLKSRTGVYDEQMKAMDSNWLDTQIEKPVDLKRAMNMKFGYMQTSFFDDITKNQNQYSAELYADLLKATGGDALTGGIVDGIEDVGEPGINEVELKNSKNYQVLTANLLGMKDPEVTKAYFKDYVLKEFEGANNYGHGNKPPVPGSGTDETDAANLNPFSKGGGSRITDANGKSIYVANTERNNRRRSVMDIVSDKSGAGTRFVGTLGDYNWDKETGLWRSGEETYETIDLMKDERLYFAGGKFEGGLGTGGKDDRLEGTFDEKSGISMSVLEQDDNDAAMALNSLIAKVRTEQNPEGYHFDITRNMFGIGEFTQDAIVLLDKNNNPVKFPKGHKNAGKTASLYTDQSKEADKQASFDYLMEILEHFNLKAEKKELTAADYAAGK